MISSSIELSHLKAFVSTAEHLHFRKAAEALGTTQPALSRKIKELEAYLDFPLFERSTRKVELLPQGNLLLQHSRKIFEQMEVAIEQCRNTAAGRAGLLRIGVVGAPVMNFIHKPLRRFQKTYPDYEIVLEEHSSTEIARRIATGSLQCGFYLSSVHQPGVKQKVVSRDTLAFALSRDHPFASRGTLRLEELHGQKILLFPRERNPVFYDQIVSRIPQLPPENLIEASSRQTAIMMAAAGLGIAVIAESIRHMCPEPVSCLSLEGPPLGPDIVMGWPKGKTNVLAAFIDKISD